MKIYFHNKYLKIGFCFFSLWLLIAGRGYSQTADTLRSPFPLIDSTRLFADSVRMQRESLPQDSSLISRDSTKTVKDSVRISPDAVKDIVEYSAKDSVYFDLNTKKIYMYRDSKVHYTDIDLSSAYIGVDLDASELTATGLPDSTGKISHYPDFKSGETGFVSHKIRYNFKTKKGLVEEVKTSDEQGTILAQKVKKYEDNSANLLNGSYSTCELDHPHFALKFKKARKIPDDKIVTGPAYLEVEGMPLPIALPFGYFPDNKKHKSGIKLPTYGESPTRGFFLQGGGFYWYINDYMDLTVTGDIYTLGSWAINPLFRYKKRYGYSGNLKLGYAMNVIGEKGDPDYQSSPDFLIQWQHSQDPKASPNGKFSANVNIRTSGFNRYNTTNIDEHLKSTFQSSINYSTTIASRFRLSVSANHSQNTQTKQMTLTLPNINLSMDKIFPLRRKKPSGKLRWYENIGLSYTFNAQGQLKTYDSLFMHPEMWDSYKNGAKHQIQINSGTIKLLKYIKWTNSAKYSERWYTERMEIESEKINIYHYIVGNQLSYEGFSQGRIIDTLTGISGFYAVREFSATSSLNTTVYGMYAFKRGPVKAIRHVLTPSLALNYHPDFTNDDWGYFDSYFDENGLEHRYYYFDNQLYSGKPGGKSGTLSLNLNQNLEMKVRSKSDTVTGTKKIKLIDNFKIGSSYNMAKDSLRWAPLSLSGNTKLFNRVNLTYQSKLDPYAADTSGKRMNVFQWNVNRRLFRPTNYSWRLSLNYRVDNKLFDGKDKEKDKGNKTPPSLLPKWNFNINYNISYEQNITYKGYAWEYDVSKQPKIIHTVGLTGSISPTPNWKISLRTNYDIEGKEVTFTEIEVYRDLHCWEMSFNWIPSGYRKSYMFSIRIKAPMLKDVKWEKRDDFRDRGL